MASLYDSEIERRTLDTQVVQQFTVPQERGRSAAQVSANGPAWLWHWPLVGPSLLAWLCNLGPSNPSDGQYDVDNSFDRFTAVIFSESDCKQTIFLQNAVLVFARIIVKMKRRLAICHKSLPCKTILQLTGMSYVLCLAFAKSRMLGPGWEQVEF